jgi:transcriptional regulator with XRE-family HTH domain
MTLGERIRELRLATGMTQAEVVRAVKKAGGKLSQGQLSAIEKGGPAGPERPRAIPELASVLGTTYDELIKLLPGTPPPSQSGNVAPTEIVKEEPPPQNVRFRPTDPAHRRGDQRGRRNAARLPVWASAEGGQGAWVVDDNPIDWIERPDFLENVVGAFAVRIIGTSMEDRYYHGEMCLVNPARIPKHGDFCLFLRNAPEGHTPETHAAIKRLVRSTARAWVVEQLHPRKQFELPKAEWRKALVVVGTYSDR